MLLFFFFPPAENVKFAVFNKQVLV